MLVKMKPTTPANKEVPEAFPFRLYDMLEDAERKGFDHIVAWLPNGDGFRVYRFDDFVNEILPLYFNQQTRYKSFQRQLNMYEFKTLMGRGLRAKAKGSGSKDDQRGMLCDNFISGQKTGLHALVEPLEFFISCCPVHLLMSTIPVLLSGTFSHPMFFRGNRNCCRLVPRKTSGVHYTTLLRQGIASLQKKQQQQQFPEHSNISTISLPLDAVNRRKLSLAILQEKMGEPVSPSANLGYVAQHRSFQGPPPASAERMAGALEVASAQTSNILRIWAGRNASNNDVTGKFSPWTPPFVTDTTSGVATVNNDDERHIPSLIPTVGGTMEWSRYTSPHDSDSFEKGRENVAMTTHMVAKSNPRWYKEHEASLTKYTQEAVLVLTNEKSMGSDGLKHQDDKAHQLQLLEPFAWKEQGHVNVNVNEEEVVDEIISTFRCLI
jgi:hypothetical protein